MNKKNNRKGFTTVELIIVIAVIAILATVMIPTFSNLITKANDSNALQTATNTWKSYTIDNPLTFSGDTVYIYVLDKDNNVTHIYQAVNSQLVKDAVADTAEEIAAFKPNCTDKLIKHDASTTGKGFLPYTAEVTHTGANPAAGKCDDCK